MANRWENKGNSNRLYFLGLQNHCRWWLQPFKKIKRCLLFGRKAMANLDSILISRDFSVDKGQCNQSYGFSSGHVWMGELEHNKGWALKNWCFWTVVLEKTLESPLDCKELKPVNPKINQSWIFIGRTDGEAEAPVLWPPDASRKRPWNWKRLKAGEEEYDRG